MDNIAALAASLRTFAHGATAALYDMGGGRALKLYNVGYPKSASMQEYNNARVVNALGVPSARVYEYLEDDDRAAIVYELVAGDNMLDVFIQGGDVISLMEPFAALHQTFLSAKAQNVPVLKDQWRASAIRGGQGKYLPLIDNLPDGDSLCHGDYHPGNVIRTASGPVAVDFMNICSGNALCDIARTVYLMEYIPMDHPPKAARRAAVDRYLENMNVRRKGVELLLPAVMAARVSETSPGAERDMLLMELSKIHFV